MYHLPYPDQSFDAVFGNAVLMRLSEPARALTELRRVLRPGGIVGIRDPDFGAHLFAPMTPLLERWFGLRLRIREHNGGNSCLSRNHRALLSQAGFAWTQASASVDSAGEPQELRRQAVFHKAQLQGLARTALTLGWLDQVTVSAIAVEFDAWAQRPDAFCAATWCEAVGRLGT